MTAAAPGAAVASFCDMSNPGGNLSTPTNRRFRHRTAPTSRRTLIRRRRRPVGLPRPQRPTHPPYPTGCVAGCPVAAPDHPQAVWAMVLGSSVWCVAGRLRRSDLAGAQVDE